MSLQPGPASAPTLSQGLVLSPTSRAQSGCSHFQAFCHSQPEVPLPTGAGVRPAPLCGRDVEPPQPFTEFSGFVLSALAMETLLVCGGVPASHLLFPRPPQCLPCSAGAGVSLLPSPTTLPKICVCASGWGPAPSLLGPGPCPVSGAVVSLWWWRRKRWGSFPCLAAKCGIYQPEL